MPKIVLTYFDGRGRCEHIRLILAYAGQEYEDKRVKFEDWPALKPRTPWGSLPMMEVDGRVLGQSIAIGRYAAKLAKLDGKDNVEQAFIDSCVDTIVEIREKVFKSFFAPEEEKAELQKKLMEEVPKIMVNLEKQLAGKTYFGGASLSWADVVLYAVYEAAKDVMNPSLEKCRGLKAIIEAVPQEPKIKAYLAKRKETEF